MKKLVVILLFVGCLSMGDTTDVSAAKYQVSIDKLQDIVLGRTVEFSIRLDSTQAVVQEMGGFDLLIRFDPYAMTFVSVDTGALLNKCGWEYFMYKYASNSPCADTTCPSGVLRLTALTDLNNGPFNHPDCFGDISGELAKITAIITSNTAYSCEYVPIQFLWSDCGDNTITSVSRTDLFLSDAVWDMGVDIAGQTNEWLYFGALEECLTTGTTTPPKRNIDFINGGIDIACVDTYDVRLGDININGIANEITDNRLFRSYFLEDTSVFTLHVGLQSQATDINQDGIPLTLEDFVYQTRIVHDDMPTGIVYGLDRNILLLLDAEMKTLSQLTDTTLGAMRIKFDSEFIVPTLLATGMDLHYSSGGGVTTVLISSVDSSNGFASGDIITWTGTGNPVEIKAVMWAGLSITNEIALPTDVADDAPLIAINPTLLQNYPNPFNNSTVISFEVGRTSVVSIEILDLLGRSVWSASGKYTSGVHSIDWPGVNYSGTDVASGMYFYRLTTNDFTQTRKMLLVK